MKRQLLFILISLLLAGCIEYQEKMKLNNNGSGEISFAIGINESFFQMGGESPEIKEFDEAKIKEKFQDQKGVKFVGSKNYVKDGNKWIEVTLSFDSVDELVKATQDTTSRDLIGEIKLKEDKDGNWVFERKLSKDKSESNPDSASADIGNGMMEAMFGSYKWRYELTVPGKIISTNAHESDVDKSSNTVKWSLSMLSLTKPQTLTVVYSKESSLNVTFIILIAVASIILALVMIILLKKKKDTEVGSS